ncbi:MAG: hypothetical protein K6F93_06335 [Lachnospiraceae bacterium]|nr:hypothetical protein [Lachnospiraceae bacterium]
MRDGFVRLMILMVIFVTGFSAIARVDTERLYFDEAKIDARSFMRTMCRMGEVTRASYTAFMNELPRGIGSFDVKINGPNGPIEEKKICEGIAYEFDKGDEIILEMLYKDRVFVCRGMVNGIRR